MLCPFIFLFLLFGSSLKAQVINVSTCAQLQNFEVNNNTVVYNITQHLFCPSFNLTTIGNNSNVFQGRIEGNSFSINHLIFSSSSPYIGFFAFGKDCTVRNLILKNITIDASNKTVGGALFANCTNCKNKKTFFFILLPYFFFFKYLSFDKNKRSINHSVQFNSKFTFLVKKKKNFHNWIIMVLLIDCCNYKNFFLLKIN